MQFDNREQFVLSDASFSGTHEGEMNITRRGCVHDMFRGLLVVDPTGAEDFAATRSTDFFLRLGFHRNGTPDGPLTFSREHLDPTTPWVSGSLLARRVQEYVVSLFNPGHASDLTGGGMILECSEARTNDEYRRLLGHDFGFWLSMSAQMVSVACRNREIVGDARVDRFIAESGESGLTQLLEDLRPSLQALRPEATRRFGEYKAFIERNIGNVPDWTAITSSLAPFAPDQGPALVDLQHGLSHFMVLSSHYDIAISLPSWICTE